MTAFFDKRVFILLLTICLVLCVGKQTQAQSYGLQFSSHETVAENRTSLDLTSEGTICCKKNLEFSFDLSLLPNYSIYFGYVFRLINDQGQNIDLIYNQKESTFQVIFGESFTNLNFRIDDSLIQSGWVKLKFVVDANKGVTISYLNKRLQSKPLGLKTTCFKLIFGVINEHDFVSRDTPPMKVRNVSIKPDGAEQYFWALNEAKGTEAIDRLQNKKAKVINANWLQPKHFQWELVESLKIKGSPSIAFNKTDESVYIISTDSLAVYSAAHSQLSSTPLSNPRKNLLDGSRSLYDDGQKKLLNYYIDQKTVLSFDSNEHRWNGDFIMAPVTEYWHANQFVYDNALYTIGGYGQLKYKNTFFKYDLTAKTWTELHPTGDFFAPRYLAGLGMSPSGDTAYIFGGYGSKEGDQVLSPKHFYDFFAYDVRKNRLTKVYSLSKPDEDFVVGNSMAIVGDNFYALTFPKERFKSSLQLIKGSLQKPVYEAMGQPLPYSFLDIKSFADLYYCKKTQVLLAVTLFTSDEGVTSVNIHRIHFPPDALVKATEGEPLAQSSSHLLLYIGIAVVLALMVLAGIFFRKSKTKKVVVPTPVPMPAIDPVAIQKEEILAMQSTLSSNEEMSPAAVQVMAPALQSEESEQVITEEEPAINRINLFGSFEVTTIDGVSMTKQFTPLLKEMFLLILLDSLRYNKGVSSEKLNEILWHDKDLKDAKNNRSVNLVKLKNILDKLGGCTINRETGSWKVEYDPEKLYIDFGDYVSIFKQANIERPNEEMANRLLRIVQSGAFLPELHYGWLDSFKSEISNFIIEYLAKYSERLNANTDTDKSIVIANAMTLFDELNEYALRLKCKSLVAQGRHTLAKTSFDKFKQKYKEIYGEEFDQSYHSVIE